MKKIFILLILIFTCISCSKKDNPIRPDVEENQRDGNFFPYVNPVFPDVSGGIFYDADISEIVQGPGLAPEEWGTLWPDVNVEYWAVAVALREVGGAATGDRQICYSFLGEDGFTSQVFEAPVQPGRIRLARVDACYYHTAGYVLDPEVTHVEVGIVYQFWQEVEAEPEDYGVWRIGLCRMIFYPATIRNPGGTFILYESQTSSLIPMVEIEEEEVNHDKPGYGQMMPDIAYDPRDINEITHNSKGDFYIVMTYYKPPYEGEPYGPRVYVKYINRFGNGFYATDWDDKRFTPPVLIQEWEDLYETDICYGYHPRIDIGEVTFFPGLEGEWNVTDWHAVVAYTADNSVFGPHFSYWPADFIDEDTWGEDDFIELPIRYYPDHGKAGFMPMVDVGPPETDLCAFTWTQTISESWDDVVVGYVDTHFADFFFDEIPGKGYLESTAFPTVSVVNDLDDEDNLVYANISYLHSDNPSSLKWTPHAVQIETDFTITGTPVSTLGQIFQLGVQLYGGYDSGSQYSNWYGFSSSSAVITDEFDNDWFWSLWSTVGEGQFNLNSVYGAYGFTNQP